MAAILTGLHARIYKASGGRFATEMKGTPMVVITTTGRTSGKKRDRPLMRIDHGGNAHVIASNNGSDSAPGWFLNLQANPSIHVQDGEASYDATAVVLEGAERDAVYEAAKAALDNFVGYEQKSSRTIPVVRLDRR